MNGWINLVTLWIQDVLCKYCTPPPRLLQFWMFVRLHDECLANNCVMTSGKKGHRKEKIINLSPICAALETCVVAAVKRWDFGPKFRSLSEYFGLTSTKLIVGGFVSCSDLEPPFTNQRFHHDSLTIVIFCLYQPKIIKLGQQPWYNTCSSVQALVATAWWTHQGKSNVKSC